MKIKTALISVSEKKGIVEFAKGLSNLGIKIISTGGTAKKLAEEGIRVVRIDEITKFPECLDGRVKTLHPYIHAGILAERSRKEHMDTLKKFGIEPIDLVVVNLYPFKETVSKDAKLEDAIENIDIGGPTMIRAAAKNYKYVSVVVNPERYDGILGEIKEKGEISLETRKILCKEAFEHTAYYDSIVSIYLRQKFSNELFPKELSLGFEKMFETRYGENPHQKGALYREPFPERNSIVNAKILNGKELSFNNIYDADSALRCVQEFDNAAAVIVKHNNPCGAATGKTLIEAFNKAYECDKVSAYGGIIALNRECSLEVAKAITSFFNEVVIAPKYSEDALAELRSKKNLRVLLLEGMNDKPKKKALDYKRINGGLVVQERDDYALQEKELKIVSKKKPSKELIEDMLFAWKVVKHVKSNAIVIAKDNATLGIGAGQMSRVNSAEFSLKQAGEKAKGAVLASDAFLPFKDTIELAASFGISAVIETGGSIRDEEVINAADEKGIVLAFTGIRHFRH